MKVGNRKIIISETLLIPDNEFAELSCNLAEGDELNVKLLFLENLESPSLNMEIDFIDNVFVFKFTNFNDSFGNNNTEPLHFGNSNAGEELTFLSVVQRMNKITNIHLQIMMEVKDA